MTEGDKMTDDDKLPWKVDHNATELIGSPKQIAWAEKIRSQLVLQWNEGYKGFALLNYHPGFAMLLQKLRVVINAACEQRDAEVWIDHRNLPALYDIAQRAKLIGQLRNELGWTAEEEREIGRKIFNRISDYAICSRPEFTGQR